MPLNSPIREWSTRTVWIIGGSTGIGAALGHALESSCLHLVVSGRNLDALEAEFPSAVVHKLTLDINDPGAVAFALGVLESKSLEPDFIFWVAGDYSAQSVRDFKPEISRQIIQTNLLSCYDGLAAISRFWLRDNTGLALRRKQMGLAPPHICWFSSVAGYRGLPLALSYGASKAGLNAFAETCYLELSPLGIDISLVCPGFVKTRLTDKNDFKMPAIISAQEASRSTLKGLAKGEFEIHFPKRFTWFMKGLRLLPAWLYFWLVRKASQ